MPESLATERPSDANGTVVAVLLIDANAFTRSCTLAGLSDAADLAVSAEAAIETATTSAPDLVLLQHHAGDAPERLSAELGAARRRWPTAMLAVLADAAVAVSLIALRAGARLVLPSEAGLHSVVAAIRLAHADLAVVPVAALTALEHPDPFVDRPTDSPALRADQLARLTPRQRDVVAVLATGLSNKAIARRLGISESTVKVHIRAIMAATGVGNRTQLVARFLTVG
ncbi:MAG TPA: response regulator transcription factor [Sphingomonas sp.]|nr:response regulator transcription factor [Sphingomonas sp.]